RLVGARRACRPSPAKPLPLHRVRDGRLEPPSRDAPRVGRPAARVPLLGARSRAERARAGVLVPLRRRCPRRRPGRVRRAPSAASGGGRVSLDSPYRGLAAFDDSALDALSFSGRERDSEIVVANLIASRLTVLYGPSGVGKSSLLRASVARSLRRLPEEPLVVVFSSWSGPPGPALAHAIAEAAGLSPGPLV